MEVIDIIDDAEMLGLNERVQRTVSNECMDWISNTFPTRMANALPVNSPKKAEVAASVQRDLTRVLLLTTHLGEVYKALPTELKERLFGEKGIVQRPKSGVTKEEANQFLYGPISVCTFIDLLRNARPDLYDRINELDILATPEEDVRDAIDIKLDFGEVDQKKRRVVHFIQLKSTAHDQVEIYRLHNEDRGKNILGAKPSGVGRLLDAVKRINKDYEGELIAQAYVITVPGFDSHSVSYNPNGIINEYAKQKLSEVFSNEGEKEGLLPKK